MLTFKAHILHLIYPKILYLPVDLSSQLTKKEFSEYYFRELHFYLSHIINTPIAITIIAKKNIFPLMIFPISNPAPKAISPIANI